MSRGKSFAPGRLVPAGRVPHGHRAKSFTDANAAAPMGAVVPFIQEASWELSNILAERKFSVCEKNAKAPIVSLCCSFTEELLTCGIYPCVFCRGCAAVEGLQPSEFISPSNDDNMPLKLDAN